MAYTYRTVVERLKKLTVEQLSNELFEELGESVFPNANSIRRKIKRVLASRPKKSPSSPELKAWNETPFYKAKVEEEATEEVPDVPRAVLDPVLEVNPVVTGRPSNRVSENPSMRTVTRKIQLLIDELLSFSEAEGITFEEVLQLIEENARKKRCSAVVDIPVDAATAFFFSTRDIVTDRTQNCDYF